MQILLTGGEFMEPIRQGPITQISFKEPSTKSLRHHYEAITQDEVLNSLDSLNNQVDKFINGQEAQEAEERGNKSIFSNMWDSAVGYLNEPEDSIETNLFVEKYNSMYKKIFEFASSDLDSQTMSQTDREKKQTKLALCVDQVQRAITSTKKMERLSNTKVNKQNLEQLNTLYKALQEQLTHVSRIGRQAADVQHFEQLATKYPEDKPPLQIGNSKVDTKNANILSEIKENRHPDARWNIDAECKTYSIKDRAKTLHDQWITDFKKSHNGTGPNKVESQTGKHVCNEAAYKELMDENIKLKMYNPKVITAEMFEVSPITNKIPFFKDKKQALDAIRYETTEFTKIIKERPTDKPGKMEKAHLLTKEQQEKLMKDIEETMNLYLECYGDSPESVQKAFIACRDMARIATYQTFFDRHMLTGSDHGILHAHHNCECSSTMESKMDKPDMPPMGKLLTKVIHYYHDIGYSVGAKGFPIKSDHPYIGAKFIENHKEYFENIFPAMTPGGKNEQVLPSKFGNNEINFYEIIRGTILNHADVFLDSDPNNLEKMIKFVVTTSDACAVDMDHKSQAIWREHPETIVQLMRLSKFITMFPEYGQFKKLEDTKIMETPWNVFPLKANVARDLKSMEIKDNFENELDFFAYSVLNSVKTNLVDIFQKEFDSGNITENEFNAYKDAISGFLNGVGAGMVIGQYGTKVNSVTCENQLKQSEKHTEQKPKYRPVIELLIGIQFALIEAALSKDLAVKGSVKVAEEFGGEKVEMKKKIDEANSPNNALGTSVYDTGYAKINLAKVQAKAQQPGQKEVQDKAAIEDTIDGEMKNWGTGKDVSKLFNEMYKALEGAKTPLNKTDTDKVNNLIIQLSAAGVLTQFQTDAIKQVTNFVKDTSLQTEDNLKKILPYLRFGLPTQNELNFMLGTKAK